MVTLVTKDVPQLPPDESECPTPNRYEGRRLLPAYAKRLVAMRMAGTHPFAVYLLFSNDWADLRRGPSDMFALAISPRQYELGKFDLRCVAGLHVFLDARARGWEWLAGELSAWAASVWWRLSRRDEYDLLEVRAREIRVLSGVWPAWWSKGRDGRSAR